ncbi:MAG: hypothetical protein ACK52I_12885 [Pseudomonadota bacterium]
MSKQYTLNERGLDEIREFLAINHKKCGDHFSREMLEAWASDAEFQISEGNPATIELRAYDCIHGCTMQYTISDAGIDAQTIDNDDLKVTVL